MSYCKTFLPAQFTGISFYNFLEAREKVCKLWQLVCSSLVKTLRPTLGMSMSFSNWKMKIRMNGQMIKTTWIYWTSFSAFFHIKKECSSRQLSISFLITNTVIPFEIVTNNNKVYYNIDFWTTICQ